MFEKKEKNEKYWKFKIQNLKNCIDNLEHKITTLTIQKEIDIHESYLKVLKKYLACDEKKYCEWREKQNAG